MKVLHLSTSDASGGAARCALRLHVGLRDLGVESRMLVLRKSTADPSIDRFRPDPGLRSRLARGVRRRRIQRAFERYRHTLDANLEAFSDDRSPFGAEVARACSAATVVHLHWIARFVDVGSLLRALPAGSHVVWTLHDMNAFTGGCHYAGGCARFTELCGACPQLGSHRERDLSRAVLERKRRAATRLAPAKLQVVTPSRWLAEEAARSSLFRGGLDVQVIPYGIDTEAFAPRDRAPARRTMGIPSGAKVVLFAAHSVRNHRKGYDLLADALRGMQEVEDLFLLSVGRNPGALPAGVAHRHLGFVEDDRLLSLIYSAADVFALPSRQDNLPAAAIESLACGTPIVGFAVGGVPEVVRDGVTGRVVDHLTGEALREALSDLLSDAARLQELRRSCREVALAEYTLDRQAGRYRVLYRRLVSE